ncbi:SPOR domain-containing protein [Cognatiluteimonas weifangensis]|uniref:SPOR domain-containing protein n=1 Tax=Cognatiluteimonas weifangensis TaxID=2303539 RepID=A0A372DI22_9GAMM|nr:SPOR domain-containing protein [Luteimonas weifangensis]RFP59220.1 SPOR domain-containing protein [Luteimonas weifangensis]
MFARALIVLLLVLNFGVAAWWSLRPAPVPVAVAQPEGVARLQLLGEVPAAARPAPVATAEAPPSSTAPARPEVAAAVQCVSFGPYPDAATAAAARVRLQPLVQRIVVRTPAAGTDGAWRVYLPRLPTAEAAQAMAQRIAAAGFGDYLVLREGADANTIALGRYSSESGARRRAATLVAAGFPARAEALGHGPAAIWLDVAAAAGFDAVHAQALAAAPGRRPLDCARLR